MVFSDDPNPSLKGSGRACRNAVARIVSGPKNKIALHSTILPRTQTDPALAFEDGVVEDFVALGFDRDDFRLSRGSSICPPNGAIEYVALYGDLHVEGLGIANPDSKRFKTVVRITAGVLRNRITRTEVTVAHLVQTRFGHTPLRDIGHEGDGGVANGGGSLREGAVLDGRVKSLDVDPLSVFRSSRTSIKTEMGQRHISRTWGRSDQVVSQDSAVRIKIQTRQDDPTSRHGYFGGGIHHHPSWIHRINKNWIILGGGVIRDQTF